MTIEQRIKDELKRLSDQNSALYSTAHNLEERFQSLTDQVKDYLSKINSEMPEYDKHDASHSEAVLDIIEQLLQEKGIEKLSLLEAIVLRFCCYFHDCGMILPSYCTPLLEKVEADPNSDPAEGLEEWLATEGRTFAQVKDLFLIPRSQDGYLDLLLGELEAYQAYWQGLPPAPESMNRGDYIKTKRHDHLRSTHSERTKTYATNLTRFFEEIIQGGEIDLARAIGDICAAHGWEYKKVRELRTDLELFRNCPEMRCNVRYLAMLLRMGDLLHFGPDRASGVLYYEQEQMGPQSDLHWRAKMNTRGYRIDPTAGGGVDITYHGSFTEPTEYYFILEHMNRVDDELICYESFRREMEKQLNENLYDLGLPEKVDRDHIAAQGFFPDQDLKFKLEHQNIIQLLMGARLYRDEFMCLRELYQNALDACRCMRAEQQTRHGAAGELEIEFGLGSDEGGDYLYCKDQGTGMTMDIVKNYLLRIGNSYYKSDEFRRRNAQWSSTVAPVSEFGIGLLSCYMIADRIDVITRHYSAPEGEPPIWISMKDADGFGYRRPTNRFQERQLGEHGTIVKLYLLDKFKNKVTGYIPEHPEDVEFMRAYCKESKKLSVVTNSLYAQVQQFVHVQEKGIHLFVKGYTGRLRVATLDGLYDLSAKLPMLAQHGIEFTSLIGHHIPDDRMLFGRRVNNGNSPTFADDLTKWRSYFAYYLCSVNDIESNSSATAYIHLPLDATVEYVTDFSGVMDYTGFDRSAGMTIDGMPAFLQEDTEEVNNYGIHYQFWGEIRPCLTVDRGAIRSVPCTVEELQTKLNEQLQRKVVTVIRDHFIKHPEALTDSAKHYLLEYLSKKFNLSFVWGILKELTCDLVRDYRYCGTSLFNWLQNEVLEIDGDTLQDWVPYGLHKIAHNIINTAIELRLENGKVRIQKNISLEHSFASRDRYIPQLEFSILRADNWPDAYAQYDAVRDYAGWVPNHVFSLFDRGCLGYNNEEPDDEYSQTINNRICDADYRLPSARSMATTDPVHMRSLDWEDIRAQLREDDNAKTIRSHRIAPLIEEGNKRYVLYIFINPRPLTEEDQAFVDEYKHIPKYLECVEKGWSILFYNYKDGYVIAPGIVDREEMLKLLPDEVWNRDDGLEYYFTDGTRAF